jgi:electron transport complex protein RnfD
VSSAARPARSLAARNACLLAALLPGLLLQWRGDPSRPAHLLLAVAAALVLEALALLARRLPIAPYLREGSAITAAAMLVAWLPALAGLPLLLAVFVAVVLARQAFGGLGRNLFHPVAVAVAFAQALAFAPAAALAPDPWLALAWAFGGLALMALRIVRWQAPLCLIAGACAGLLASGHGAAALADPRWLLAAFFVAGDSVTVAEDARARALTATLAGALAGVGGVVALPFALLAMNAAAPAVDAWLARRRAQAQPA